jgi:hypothetical protein
MYKTEGIAKLLSKENKNQNRPHPPPPNQTDEKQRPATPHSRASSEANSWFIAQQI